MISPGVGRPVNGQALDPLPAVDQNLDFDTKKHRGHEQENKMRYHLVLLRISRRGYSRRLFLFDPNM